MNDFDLAIEKLRLHNEKLRILAETLQRWMPVLGAAASRTMDEELMKLLAADGPVQ